jgi:hypothetical protein
MCDDCRRKPEPAVFYCHQCEQFYCSEHDAAIHTGKRKLHKRVAAQERPAYCPVHEEVATGFCLVDERFTCPSCVIPTPAGPCYAHYGQVKSFEEAAGKARERLTELAAYFCKDEEAMQSEVTALMQLVTGANERLSKLRAALVPAQRAQLYVGAATALSHQTLLEQYEEARLETASMRDALIASAGETGPWKAQWVTLYVAVKPHRVRCVAAECWAACLR